MPVKYQCPNCDKRFVDWGAAKLGFKCPNCKDTDLVRLGVSDDKAAQRPTLKRHKKKPAKRPVEEPAIATVDLAGVNEAEIGEGNSIGRIDLSLQEDTAPEAVEANGDKAEAINGSKATGDEEPDDDLLDEKDASDMPQDLNFEENGAVEG